MARFAGGSRFKSQRRQKSLHKKEKKGEGERERERNIIFIYKGLISQDKNFIFQQ